MSAEPNGGSAFDVVAAQLSFGRDVAEDYGGAEQDWEEAIAALERIAAAFRWVGQEHPRVMREMPGELFRGL